MAINQKERTYNFKYAMRPNNKLTVENVLHSQVLPNGLELRAEPCVGLRPGLLVRIPLPLQHGNGLAQHGLGAHHRGVRRGGEAQVALLERGARAHNAQAVQVELRAPLTAAVVQRHQRRDLISIRVDCLLAFLVIAVAVVVRVGVVLRNLLGFLLEAVGSLVARRQFLDGVELCHARSEDIAGQAVRAADRAAATAVALFVEPALPLLARLGGAAAVCGRSMIKTGKV